MTNTLFDINTRGFVFLPNHLPAPFAACLASAIEEGWKQYLSMIVFEGIVGSLIFFKFYQYTKERSWSWVEFVLVRDGFVESIAILSVLAFSLSVQANAKHTDIWRITASVVPSICAICCSRILLNIRDLTSMTDDMPPPPWSPLNRQTDTIGNITYTEEQLAFAWGLSMSESRGIGARAASEVHELDHPPGPHLEALNDVERSAGEESRTVHSQRISRRESS